MNIKQPAANDAPLNIFFGIFWGIIALVLVYCAMLAYDGVIVSRVNEFVFGIAALVAACFSISSFRHAYKRAKAKKLNTSENPTVEEADAA